MRSPFLCVLRFNKSLAGDYIGGWAMSVPLHIPFVRLTSNKPTNPYHAKEIDKELVKNPAPTGISEAAARFLDSGFRRNDLGAPESELALPSAAG
jgi:hypothetical protein